jgi:hypothetical protein
MMTVYVVQKQMRFDEGSGELVPRFKTLDRAQRFGAIEYLLSPSAHPFNPEHIIGDLHDKLKEFGDQDYLLLIGNPALIGMAATVASHYNGGKLKLLQWSGRQGDYAEISVRMF